MNITVNFMEHVCCKPSGAVSFLWHVLSVAGTGISPVSRPVEPGLSSPLGAATHLTLLLKYTYYTPAMELSSFQTTKRPHMGQTNVVPWLISTAV